MPYNSCCNDSLCLSNCKAKIYTEDCAIFTALFQALECLSRLAFSCLHVIDLVVLITVHVRVEVFTALSCLITPN